MASVVCGHHRYKSLLMQKALLICHQYWHHTPIPTRQPVTYSYIRINLNTGWKDGVYGQMNQNRHISPSLCGEVIAQQFILTGRSSPQGTAAKYLGNNPDRRLTWKPHIRNKRKLGPLLQRIYWITGRKFKLSLTNKLLIYKIILKPIWTYGIPLWGTASQSNIEVLQRLQNRILRMATNALR